MWPANSHVNCTHSDFFIICVVSRLGPNTREKTRALTGLYVRTEHLTVLAREHSVPSAHLN